MSKNKRKAASEREAAFLQFLVGGEKYGLELQEKYEAEKGERLPAGSLYVTLDRMEAAGFVKSRMGEDTHERGGNRRRYFKMTGEGARALDVFRDALMAKSRFHLGLGGAV